MTNNRKLLCASLAVALVVALCLLVPLGCRSWRSASVPEKRPMMTRAVREELEKFQGAWAFVSLEVDGDKKPDADFKKYTVVFEGNQWIVSEGTNVAAQTTIVLDPTAKPTTIDAFPPPGKGDPMHGIYVLEGNKLTICNRGEDKGDRPTDFSTEPNSGLVLIVYERARP
ncbi:MAG: TIGR03067 domain-containing protein [Limisphaerales bacterium]